MRFLLFITILCGSTNLFAQSPEINLLFKCGINQPFSEENENGFGLMVGSEVFLPKGRQHGFVLGLAVQHDNWYRKTSSLTFANTSSGSRTTTTTGFEVNATSIAAQLGYAYRIGKFQLRTYGDLSRIVGGNYKRLVIGGSSNLRNGNITHSGRIGQVTNEELTRHTLSTDTSTAISLGGELIWSATDRFGIGINFAGTLGEPTLQFSEAECASANNCNAPLQTPFNGVMYAGRKSLRLSLRYLLFA